MTNQQLQLAAAQGRLADAIEQLRSTRQLHLRLPEIYWMRGVEQSPQYHREGDVYQHTMLVLRAAKPDPVQQWAAALHDVGKPATQATRADGHISFLRHELVGADLVPGVLLRVGYPEEFSDLVRRLVHDHMKPHQLPGCRKRTLRRFVRRQGPRLEALLDLADADAAGSFRADGQPAKPNTRGLRERIAQLGPEPTPPPQHDPLPLSGHDIMRILGCPPGPRVGAAQRWLRGQLDVDQMTADRAEQLLRRYDETTD